MTLRWFRFHLSTAVLLMFAAGGLVGLNVRHRFVQLGMMNSGEYHAESCYGFPLSAWIENGDLIHFHIDNEAEFHRLMANDPQVERTQYAPRIGFFWRRPPGKYSPFGIVIDILFALAVLFFAALISEHFIRRRKTPEQKPS